MTVSTDDHSIPPVRDLPAGRLSDRQQHLLAEITPQPRKRLALPTFSRPRLRFAALAVAGACAAGGAAALAVTLSGGSGGSGSAYVLQTVHGGAWSGVGFSAASLQPLKANSSSPAKTDIQGGTVGQRTLLHSIIRAMQPNAITKIEVTSSGTQVTLRMKATDNSMETQWQESLVAAAFRDRAAAAGNHVTVALDNGDQYGGIGLGPAKTPPAAKPGDTQAARKRFEHAAAKAGVRLDQLAIYRPDGVAVAATFKSSDPASFLVHQMPKFLAAIGYGWHGYDGVYVGLIDASGATVWQTSTAIRTSTGTVGWRQDLAGCSPVGNFGGFPTPPCHVK
jgi:hypothetical protein